MYAITGATGHTGNRIARELLVSNLAVRAIGRSAERLQPLVDEGAEAFVGDLGDEHAMERALHGARAVYTLIPPQLDVADLRGYQHRVGTALARAIEAAGVRYVVNLSSVGAQLAEGVGPIIGLHDQEQRLDRLAGVNVLHLRPGYFMENLFMLLPELHSRGVLASPLRPDVPLAMIATADIADYAVRRLRELDFTGKAKQELLGHREVTMQEVTRMLGPAIGDPNLEYVQLSYSEAEGGLRAAGASPDVAHQFIEMSQAYNEGRLGPTERRSAANTTPTGIEDFIPLLAAAYRHGAMA